VSAEDRVVFPEQLRHQHARHIIADFPFAAVEVFLDGNQGIFLFRIDTQSHVGRQGPRRGRPGGKPGVGLVPDLEPDEDRRVLDVLIALGHLMARE